jgi:hypothetical protein
MHKGKKPWDAGRELRSSDRVAKTDRELLNGLPRITGVAASTLPVQTDRTCGGMAATIGTEGQRDAFVWSLYL